MTASSRLAQRYKAAKSEAEQLGEEAFNAGRKRVPAQDPGIMKWLRSNPHNILQSFKDWNRGWDKANLAAP